MTMWDSSVCMYFNHSVMFPDLFPRVWLFYIDLEKRRRLINCIQSNIANRIRTGDPRSLIDHLHTTFYEYYYRFSEIREYNPFSIKHGAACSYNFGEL